MPDFIYVAGFSRSMMLSLRRTLVRPALHATGMRSIADTTHHYYRYSRNSAFFSRELLLKLNKGIDDKRYKDDIAS